VEDESEFEMAARAALERNARLERRRALSLLAAALLAVAFPKP
jgi:hypothetical protein